MTPSQSSVNDSHDIDQRRHEISRSHQSPEYWFAQNHRKNCYCFLYQLIREDRLDTNSWHTEALQSKENLWHEWDSNPHTSLMLIPLRHKTPRRIFVNIICIINHLHFD